MREALTSILILTIAWKLINGAESADICNSAVSCHKYHLTQRGFNESLLRRCQIPNKDPVYVDFTHIPKSGGLVINEYMHRAIYLYLILNYFLLGTTVSFVLSKIFYRKYAPQAIGFPHNSFAAEYQLLKQKSDDTTFVTMFRNPVDLDISLYLYINGPGKPKLTPKLFAQRDSTFRVDYLKWAHSSFGIASNNSVLMFTTDLDSVKYKPIVDLSLYNINYANNLPLEYRCINELKALRLVMERYSVIGVLEHIDKFWKIVSSRLNVSKDLLGLYSNTHRNKSQRGNVTFEQEFLMREQLKHSKHFFCANLLYDLINEVSQSDFLCINK